MIKKKSKILCPNSNCYEFLNEIKIKGMHKGYVCPGYNNSCNFIAFLKDKQYKRLIGVMEQYNAYISGEIDDIIEEYSREIEEDLARRKEFVKNQYREHNCKEIVEANQFNCCNGESKKIKIIYDNPFTSKQNKEWFIKIYNKSDWCSCETIIIGIRHCSFCGESLYRELEEAIEACENV